MKNWILVINPGSTSTKLGLYEEKNCIKEESISHSKEELERFETFYDQTEFRKNIILQFLENYPDAQERLRAVVGRGGLLKPIPSGTYLVDEEMLEDLRTEKYQSHASNLGAVLADAIAQRVKVAAYIVDPVVVDELQPLARLSGLKGIERRSIAHVLNQKAVARKVLTEHGKIYKDSTVIVAHLGGGISIGAHQKGQMIDVVNGLDGEGPFSAERSGALPLYPFAQQILKDTRDLSEIKKMIAGQGGLYSYLNETDLRKIQAGPSENRLYVDAMCYQISKSIGEMAVVLKGQVDLIILTGGMALSSYVIEQIEQAVSWIAPLKVVPGQMEMEALLEGVMRVLDGVEQAKSYQNVAVEEMRIRHGN